MINDDRDHIKGREDQAAEEDPRDALDRLVNETIREPWFAALRSLTDREGWWVGTEEELVRELEARAVRDASRSEGFRFRSYVSERSYVSGSDETPLHVEYAFRQECLSIIDYREIEKEHRGDFDAPGWGRKAPILIQRNLAALKPSYEGAKFMLATDHRNPLAVLVVALTYHDPRFKRNNQRWSGRTRELAKRLRTQLYNEVGWNESRTITELRELLDLEELADFRRFCKQMRTCAHILKDVGVKVSWEKVTDRKAATGEEYTYTRWTIEAPRWGR